MSLHEGFADLFAGREAAYGTDYGGSVRFDAEDDIPWHWQGDDGLWAQHLAGVEPIGVYPMVPAGYDWDNDGMSVFGWGVKWGCVDFDVLAPGKRAYDYASEDEAHEAALNLVDVLAAFGIRGWIEVTKSRGRHVWVFANGWVPAKVMRRALLVACKVAEVSDREVNPKSDGEGEPPEFLGNYVRLPYPGDEPGLDGPRARTILMDGVSMAVGPFVQYARVQRASAEDLESLAQYYVEHKPVLASREKAYDVFDVELSRDITSKLGGLAYTILNEGPLPEGDRSTTLMRLAHLCREDGLTPDEALAVVSAADLSWGKFHARRDGERRLEQMVEQAYYDWEYV